MRCRSILSSSRRRAASALWLLACIAATGSAQPAGLPPTALHQDLSTSDAVSSTPTTLEAALRSLFAQADVVFTGEVTRIERTATAVEVHWRVEDAVRGAVAGGQYTVREWAGLWQGASDRYVRGERALVLLHAPSAAGFSSPVGGADGVIALRGSAGTGQLDLGLLQQRVLVTDEARLRPVRALQAAGGSLSGSDALQREEARLQPARRVLSASTGATRTRNMVQVPDEGSGETGPVAVNTPVVTPPAAAATDGGSIDAGVVMSLLQAWQRQRGAQ